MNWHLDVSSSSSFRLLLLVLLLGGMTITATMATPINCPVLTIIGLATTIIVILLHHLASGLP